MNEAGIGILSALAACGAFSVYYLFFMMGK